MIVGALRFGLSVPKTLRCVARGVVRFLPFLSGLAWIASGARLGILLRPVGDGAGDETVMQTEAYCDVCNDLLTWGSLCPTCDRDFIEAEMKL